MSKIIGTDRQQISMISLDGLIDENNEVRVIDLYIDQLNIEKLGFKEYGKMKEGRPAFHRKDLLKLYLYGYLNRIRSSRELAKACKRNIDLWWLLKELRPKYRIIAKFREENFAGLVELFKNWTQFMRAAELVGGQLVAIDGTKISAQNSLKNNFNALKVDRHLKYNEEKAKEYLAILDQMDERESSEMLELQAKLDHITDRDKKYNEIKEFLKEKDEEGIRQISTSDPDARALPEKMSVKVSYNIQSTVDDKHHLPVDVQATNERDTEALGEMSKRAKEVLKVDVLDVLADKGYHSGAQFKICEEENIKTYVAIPERNSGKKHPDFRKDKFQYDESKDAYICPAGKELKTKGVWYNKKGRRKDKDYKFQRYEAKLAECRSCPFQDKCGPFGKGHGRYVERTEFDAYTEKNRARVESNKELYKRRQSIVEHPFGTIKRQWGYNYTLMKGLEKVQAEVSLIFLSYNIRRTINILGIDGLMELLKKWEYHLFVKMNLILKAFERINFITRKLEYFYINELIYSRNLPKTWKREY